MAVTISTGLRNTILETIVNGGTAINFNSGTIQIRTGSPAGPDAAVAGTLLIAITLPADAFAAASGGSAAKSGTWSGTATGTGTAGYFRLSQSGDANGASTSDERIEGTVTATGGGGDMTLDNTSITSGQTVTIQTFTITMPAS